MLAGGRSTRMGRDKALLELEGETLVERATACFEALDRPAPVLEDRFRIVDEGAQSVRLDGRQIVIDYRPPFLIIRALFHAPEYQLTAEGRRALGRYLDHMEALIQAMRDR